LFLTENHAIASHDTIELDGRLKTDHKYRQNRQMSYQDFIEITPGRGSSKPCIKNTRITVYDVLGWLASGLTQQEIIEDFPELNRQQIQSCLAYAAEREHHLLTVNAARNYC
jgi:uncharacterized protein (DUF433 family)